MNELKKCFIGIDTSNYTTSVAVCSTEGEILANHKAQLPVKSGECGLRQSDAVFAHTKNLPMLMDRLSESLLGYKPIAVGVSATPRMAEGSYMPCFLCGIAAAHAFAAQGSLPIYKTAHQNGHIMAAMYSAGKVEYLMQKDFFAFHVSGGTTEALLVHPNKDRTDFEIELVGETLDINAGQAIDRIGVMLGLDFPCGAALERLSSSYLGEIQKKKITVKDGKCSLSGLENIAQRFYNETEDKAATAALVFDFICRTLEEMAKQIVEKYGNMPVLFAGGVMSNKVMRTRLGTSLEAYFSEAEFSSDNAAGVALLARLRAIKEGII